MPTFRLVYEEDRHGVPKWIEFEAPNASGALKFAKGEAQGRWAQLFEEGRFLCRLERIDPDGANIWMVGPLPPEGLGELAGLMNSSVTSERRPLEGLIEATRSSPGPRATPTCALA